MRINRDYIDIGLIAAGSCMAGIGMDRFIEANNNSKSTTEYKTQSKVLAILGIGTCGFGFYSFFWR